MSEKLFGTDGIRGEAGHFPLDGKTVRLVGLSLAHQLRERHGRDPLIVIGRDTRESGYLIEQELIAGATEARAECRSAGVITTPGVAFLARALPADAGGVISASHNPFRDNGVKVFAPDGRKIDDETEARIEYDILNQRHAPRSGELEALPGRSPDSQSGGNQFEDSLQSQYLEYLSTEVASGIQLDGLRIVLDCANGAAYRLGPALFTRLGATVTGTNCEPNGRNINNGCGALYLDGLRNEVLAGHAAIGVAYDGDADRSMFIDSKGNVVDGDAILWILGKRLSARKELTQNRVVATVMSNIGLELAFRSKGIELLRSNVGDKYVLEELLRTGAALGGEQSGHIIFPYQSLAGDGMLTTINILRAMQETGRNLNELTEGFERYPQVLVNVRVGRKIPFQEVSEISTAADQIEKELGSKGRLLLRYSGTEPLARIMIEGEQQQKIEDLANSLAQVITKSLGTEKAKA